MVHSLLCNSLLGTLADPCELFLPPLSRLVGDLVLLHFGVGRVSGQNLHFFLLQIPPLQVYWGPFAVLLVMRMSSYVSVVVEAVKKKNKKKTSMLIRI